MRKFRRRDKDDEDQNQLDIFNTNEQFDIKVDNGQEAQRFYIKAGSRKSEAGQTRLDWNRLDILYGPRVWSKIKFHPCNTPIPLLKNECSID